MPANYPMETPGTAGLADIRRAESSDLQEIAAIHRSAFGNSFLSNLGSEFLERYYSMILGYKDGILLVAPGSGRTEGFVAGFLKPASFYRQMWRPNWQSPSLIGPTFRAVLRQPSLIGRVIYHARRLGKPIERCSAACELSSIAVRPEAGKKGVGRALVQAFLDGAWARDSHYVYLTTDAEGNDAANHLYGRLGFQLGRQFEQYKGRPMNEFVIGSPARFGRCDETP